MTRGSLDHFVAELLRHDIKLSVDGQRLRCSAPKGVITPELQGAIAERKAELLKFLTSVQQAPRLPPLRPAPPGAKIPLSYAQEGAWFIDQLQPGAAFNIGLPLRFQGPLNINCFRQALDEIVHRHAVLRTNLASDQGHPLQVVHPAGAMPLTLVDLAMLTEPAKTRELLSAVLSGAQRPFDLSHEPLARMTIFRLAAEEHLLHFVVHHTVFDGWSIGIFVRELSELYAAFCAARLPSLPTLSVQYSDYAVWQRALLEGPFYQSQVDYWRRQLADYPPSLDLATDHRASDAQLFRGDVVSLALPPALREGVRQLAHREGVTLFMLLLAAFKALLARTSGQEDLVVGTPFANRNQPEMTGVIGFCVNLLALRTDLSGNPPFRELLRRVREVCLGAYSHQELPFGMLVRELQPERSMQHSPIFQVQFALHELQTYQFELAGLRQLPTFESMELSDELLSQTAHSTPATDHLFLNVVDAGDHLGVVMHYRSDLFHAESIRRTLRHFQTLLEEVVADPTRGLWDIPLLPPDERRRLLTDWSATQDAYAQGDCIHALFEAQARRQPDAIAVIVPAAGEKQQEVRLSYGELNRRANQLAHTLRRRGVACESRVGICLERSPETIVAVWAVLKAGGAFVPIDPAHGPARMRYMLEDSQAHVVLTRRDFLPEEPPGACHVVWLDEEQETIGQMCGENPPVTVSDSNLAYLVYTSGSTGRPKGVMVSHRSLVNAYRAWEHEYDLRDMRRHLQMASFSFDVFVGDLTRALCSGAAMVLCPRESLLLPEELHALLRDYQIDCAEFVPAVVRALMEHLHQWGSRIEGLKLAAVGSDSWYAAEYRQLKAVLGERTRVINSYGVAEATIDSTYFEDFASSLAGDGLLPIGRPFAGSEVYVLDRRLEPTPLGVPGELYLGGAGLAQGYWDRPELTAERFIPHPFSDRPGARLYRTGDRVRFLSDGNLEFIGRADNQIKIRGFRIEPGEVEAAIGEHPLVQQAAVVAQGEHTGEKRLVAYLAAKPGENLVEADVRRFLHDKLPQHMVPSVLVILDDLPLTPNGKINRRALPAPDGASLEPSSQYVAPRTLAEMALARIWAETLNAERVGIHDDFFALGGHSLLAARLIARMRSELKVELPLRKLFEHSSVAALATVIEAALSATGPPLPRIIPTSREGRIPLSYAQEGAWFVEQLQPGTPFSIPLLLRVRGAIDMAAMHSAVEAVFARHEALRTHFAEAEGEPFQVISPAMKAPLTLIDLGDLEPSCRERELVRRLIEAARVPFDFARGPMARMTVLRLSPSDHVFFWNVHHIVFDGYSVGVFIRDLAACYEAACHGTPIALPPLTVQYADYAAWQREVLSGEFLESQVEYWRKQLAHFPSSLELGTARRRAGSKLFQGEVVSVTLPEPLTNALRTLSQQEGVTLFMLLLAAFKTLLARYSGQQDIIVGTPVANRDQPEMAGVIGFCVNVLALRTNLEGNPTFRHLLQRVREVCLDAFSHQEVPFGLLVQRLKPDRHVADSPFFQVSFSLLDARAGSTQLPSGLELSTEVDVDAVREELRTLQADVSPATDYLFLQMVDAGTNLTAMMQHRSDLFEPEVVQRMMGHLVRLLEGVVADAETPLADIPLLGDEETNRLLRQWSCTRPEYPPGSCIHQLFEAQASATPDALAVVAPAEDDREECRLTYGQLNARANQLAWHLLALGIRREARVGICLTRSPEMIVAVWAVLKAGAAFVPLDPSYGAERLRYMLDNAGAALILSEQGILPPGLETDASVIDLAREREAIAHRSVANPPLNTSDQGLAYLVYTSGSTGHPKGVMVSHYSVVNAYRAWEAEYGLPQTRRHLQMASFSFDVFVGDLARALCSGAALVLCPRETLLMPELLYGLLRRYEIDCAEFVPAVVRVLIEHLQETNQRLDFLKLLVVGSDSWYAGEYRSLQRLAGPRTRVVNSYGVAEATIDSTYFESLDDGHFANDQFDDDHGAEQLLPIGRPFAGSQVYVLDPHLNLAPIGVAGELYLGGAGLARGYCDRPDLTSERFVPHPFSQRRGERLYRTGDRVRFLPDGRLEFIGRVDRQIKIRGFRIEPGEVESVLSEHPEVAQAVVIGQIDAAGEMRLVAYVTAADSADLDKESLQSYLGGKLPAHMVPSMFVVLDQMPLAPGGKVDRRALSTATGLTIDSAQEYVAPQTSDEEQLCRLWSAVLGVERLGVRDNFFALGGDSLSAARVVARIRTELGLELPLRALFEHPQVAPLAEQLAELRATGVQRRLPAEIVAIQPRGDRAPLFLVHAADGNVVTYLDLARHLDSGQPVYGLQHPGLLDSGDPDCDLADLALRYAEAIRQVQPDGPYLLAGWSLGGLLAFEIARRLDEQGADVALVALLDSWAWNSEAAEKAQALARVQTGEQLGFPLEEFLQFSPQEQWDYLLKRARQFAGESEDVALLERMAEGFGLAVGQLLFLLDEVLPAEADQPWTPLLEAARQKHGRPTEQQCAELRRSMRVVQGLLAAVPRHVLKAYSGRLTLVRTSHWPENGDRTLGWGKLAAAGVDVRQAGGDHYSMLKEPHVRQLARTLNELVQRATSHNPQHADDPLAEQRVLSAASPSEVG